MLSVTKVPSKSHLVTFECSGCKHFYRDMSRSIVYYSSSPTMFGLVTLCFSDQHLTREAVTVICLYHRLTRELSSDYSKAADVEQMYLGALMQGG